jgi:hypothetical protein
MNTTSTFKEIHNSNPKTSNASTFIFEDLKYVDCIVNGKTLRACIYAHEMLLQNFGFWVWFSDGSNFLTCMDLNSSNWVTLVPEGEMYADAIQANIEAFFQDNYDKLCTVSIGWL